MSTNDEELGHVLPQQQQQRQKKPSSSAAGLPPPALLLLVLALAWSLPRLLAALVNVAQYAVGGLPPLLHSLFGLVAPGGLLGLIPIACVAVLAALDGKVGTAFRVAAAVALAVAWGWGFVAHLVPDGLRPSTPMGAFLLFGLVPAAGRLVFAHWIAALLVSARRQPVIAVVAWWGALTAGFLSVVPVPYVAELVTIIVNTVFLLEILRLRGALFRR